MKQEFTLFHCSPDDRDEIPCENTLFYKWLASMYQYTLRTPKLGNDIARYLTLDVENGERITKIHAERLGEIWVEFFTQHTKPMMAVNHLH